MRRIRIGSSFPDDGSAIKILYLSIDFNSRYASRKMNGYHKCYDEVKEMLNKRYYL